MSSDLEIRLKILAEAKGAIKAVEDTTRAEKELKKQTDQLANSQKRAQKSADDYQKSLNDINKASSTASRGGMASLDKVLDDIRTTGKRADKALDDLAKRSNALEKEANNAADAQQRLAKETKNVEKSSSQTNNKLSGLISKLSRIAALAAVAGAALAVGLVVSTQNAAEELRGLQDGSITLEELSTQAKVLNNTMSEMDVARLIAVNDQWALGKDNVSEFGGLMANGLAPIFHGVMSNFNQAWVDLGITQDDVNKAIVNALGWVLDRFDTVRAGIIGLEIGWLQIKQSGIQTLLDWGEMGAKFADVTLGGIVRAFGAVQEKFSSLAYDASAAFADVPGMKAMSESLRDYAFNAGQAAERNKAYKITIDSLESSHTSTTAALAKARAEYAKLQALPAGTQRAQTWIDSNNKVINSEAEKGLALRKEAAKTGKVAQDAAKQLAASAKKQIAANRSQANAAKKTATERKKQLAIIDKAEQKRLKDQQKIDQAMLDSRRDLKQGYDDEITALKRRELALKDNEVALIRFDLAQQKFGENQLTYNQSQIEEIANRASNIILLEEEKKKREEVANKLKQQSDAALKLLRDSTRAVELETLAQTQGIEAARLRELFYETGSKARAKEIFENEKILDGLEKQKQLWQELSDIVETVYDSVISSLAGGGSINEGLSNIGPGIVDAAKQSSDIYIKAAGYAAEVISAIFSDTLSEAEILAAKGRSTGFDDNSINQLIALTETTQYPMLELTKKMRSHLSSMDNKFAIVAGALGVQSNVDISGSNFVSTTQVGTLGFNSKETEFLASGLVFELQNFGDAITDGLDAWQFLSTKITRSSWWGLSSSESIQEQLSAIDGAVINDLTAILNTGRELIVSSASSLGVDIAAQIDQYQIDVGKIDFSGLDDTQIQERLNKLFSEIFSGAISKTDVSILVDQYAQLGEASLETLGRIAVEYEQANYSIAQTGKVISDFAGELVLVNGEIVDFSAWTPAVAKFLDGFAHIQDAVDAWNNGNAARTAQQQILDIVKFSGGLELFNDNMNAFVNEFYSDVERFEIQQQTFNDSFTAIGYTLSNMPDTRDDWRDLVNGIDTTTEAGAQLYAETLALSGAFAALDAAEIALAGSTDNLTLNLADAEALFDRVFLDGALALAEAESIVAKFPVDLNNLKISWVDFINSIEGAERDRAIKETANVQIVMDARDRAAAEQKRRDREAQQAQQRLADERQRAYGQEIRRLEKIRDLNDQLNDLYRQLADIDLDISTPGGTQTASQIAVKNAQDAIDAHSNTINTLRDSVNVQQRLYDEDLRLREEQLAAVQQARDYLDSLLLDDNVSNLTAAEKLAEAQSQYQQALASGDVADTQAAMQKYLELARKAYGSTDQYDAILAGTTTSFEALLDSIVAMPDPSRDILDTAIAQLAAADAQTQLLRDNLDVAREALRVEGLESTRADLAQKIQDKLAAVLALETTAGGINTGVGDVKANTASTKDRLGVEGGGGDNIAKKLSRIATRLWSDSDSLGAAELLGLIAGSVGSSTSPTAVDIATEIGNLKIWWAGGHTTTWYSKRIRDNLKQQNKNWDVSGKDPIPSFAKGVDYLDVRAHDGERILPSASNKTITNYFQQKQHLNEFKPVVVNNNNNEQLAELKKIRIANEKMAKRIEELEKKVVQGNKLKESRIDQADAIAQDASEQRNSQKKATKNVADKIGKQQKTAELIR